MNLERNIWRIFILFSDLFINCIACPICADVAKKDSGYGKGIYRLDDLMAGTNAAPMHPFCRCAISPYEDTDEYEAWIDFLDNGGTTEEWNAYEKSKWMHIGKNIVKPIENNMNSDIIKKTGLMKLNLQFFASKEKQFGKKIGKHARDYGMNPSVKEDREKMKEIGLNTDKMNICNRNFYILYNHLYL